MSPALRRLGRVLTVVLLLGGSLMLVTPAAAAEIQLQVTQDSKQAPANVHVKASYGALQVTDPPVFTLALVDAGGSTVQSRTVTARLVPNSSEFSDWVAETDLSITTPGSYTVTASTPSDPLVRHPVTVSPPPVPPPSVSITAPADGSSSPEGTPVTIAAGVEGGDGTGRWGLWASFPGQEIASSVPFTDNGRSITASYAPSGPGRVTILARWSDDADSELSSEDSVTHTWDPRPPDVAISRTSPTSPSSLVGEELGFKVTVDPFSSSGKLAVSVAGANPASDLAFSGSEGTYTGSYTGTATGRDTVTATWTDGPTTVVHSFTHDWVAPRVQLSLTASPGELGEEAVVRVDLPDGALGGSVAVEVLDGSPHAGPLTAELVGDHYEARYEGTVPGTDRIQAVLSTEYGDFPSDTVSTTWATPTVTLSQETSESAVGGRATVSAEVTGARDSEITFDVAGANGDADVAVSGTHPAYTASYTGTVEGADAITATVVVGGRAYTSASLGHTWFTPGVTVAQDLAVSRPGQDVVLSATVVPPGLAGPVTFTVESDQPDQPPLSFLDDGADGSYTATYTRDDEGTDTITATYRSGDAEFASEAIAHTWDDEEVPAVVLSPAGASTCTGSPFTPSVTLTDGADPVADTQVAVTVSAPGLPDQELTATTDADGRATVSYTSAASGLEGLVARAEVDGQAVASTRLDHVWEACELAVTIAPPGTTTLVGSTFTPTVSVVDAEGSPVGGATVDLRVVMDGEDDVVATLTTDANGLASHTYDRDVEGTERITAEVTEGARRGTATIDHFWAEQEGLEVSLAPAGTTSLAGSPFTAIALVTDGEQPVPGARVTFLARLPGQPDISTETTTDDLGQASFTYTRPVSGIDTVTADVVVEERTGRAAMVHRWDLVPGLALALEPAGQSSAVGTEVTVTATLLVDEAPARDVEIRFRAAMAGTEDSTGTARTDAEGSARFSWSRDTVGTDTVVASVSLPDGRRGEAAVTHLWTDESPDGPVVREDPPDATVAARGVLVPQGLATITGTGCPSGSRATLLIDGEEVATARVGRNGSYETEVRLGDLAVGQYPLEARCDPVLAESSIDIVVPTAAVGTAGAAATTALATFGFFVLLGSQLLRQTGGYATAGS